MSRFTRGDDFTDTGASFKTFGINEGEWGNKIEVHGDYHLRHRILKYLNRTTKYSQEEKRERARTIVGYRDSGLTLKEIGAKMGLHKERIRQIINQEKRRIEIENLRASKK